MVVSLYTIPTHKISIKKTLPDLFTEFIANITINITVIDKQVVIILHAKMELALKRMSWFKALF